MTNTTTQFARFRRPLTAVLCLYWLAMFIGTHIPNPEGIIPQEVSDKSLHFAAYFGLAVLLAVRRMTIGVDGLRTYMLLLVLIAVYGLADEVLQIPVQRTADFQDWLADMAGAVTGLAFMAVVNNRLSSRSS